MGCYYGKFSSDLSEEEKGTFRTSLRGSLDFYKSLLKNPMVFRPSYAFGQSI